MSQGPLPIEWAGAVTQARGLWGYALRAAMEQYIHQAGLKIVGETLPCEENRVRLAEVKDQYGLPVAHATFSYGPEHLRLIDHAIQFMTMHLEAAGAREIWHEAEETAHLMGTCRMGTDRRSSVTNPDGRTWDIPNLWICDASLFPTSGGVNPSLTVQALACRIGDRIRALAARGEL